ncbi:MAG TPA: GNAT family N-acetyltransferase [Ignavibacteria bacterium]|nr:GNAT family N-acetyltransferase [Ignavibacteria bacterium]
MEIVQLSHDHWSGVKRIYEEGIATRNATFETEAPSREEWDKKHHDICRFAAVDNGEVLGWAALIPTSTRKVYAGVMEISIYIGEKHRDKGVGKALMEALIAESEKNNIWSLLSVLFPENTASIKLHEKFGFRIVGIREKMGKMGDTWRDNVMMERRSDVVGYEVAAGTHFELETERLVIKLLDESFSKQVLEYHTRNKDFFRPYVSDPAPAFFTDLFTKRMLRKYVREFTEGLSLKLYLFEKSDTGLNRVIGDIGFTQIVREPFLSCFLGYKIDEEENGKGYASEALKVCIDYVFNVMKLHRIEANIVPGNLPSIKLVGKLGFINEGLSKKYLRLNGVWQDHLHYVLLNPQVE